MRKFKKEDLLEMDFKAYLASSSDEDEPKQREENRNGDVDSSEDEDKKIEKYKVSQTCLWPFSSSFKRGTVNFIFVITIPNVQSIPRSQETQQWWFDFVEQYWMNDRNH